MRVTLASDTPAELAEPTGAPVAGLVLIPDIGGLRPLFDRHVRRLAEELQAIVVAPEPFPGRESMPVPERLAVMGEMDDSTILAYVDAAADRTGQKRVWVIGFCMGGMYAMKAIAGGRFESGVAFYGMIRVPGQWKGPGQSDALDMLIESGNASRVLAIIGGVDQWTPRRDVEDLESAGATVVVYPEGDHGFVHDPDRPAHRANDAAAAWLRACEWLRGRR